MSWRFSFDFFHGGERHFINSEIYTDKEIMMKAANFMLERIQGKLIVQVYLGPIGWMNYAEYPENILTPSLIRGKLPMFQSSN